MSAKLFRNLQNSATPQQLLSACEKIIEKNDPSLRVKEIIPIILGKKQLILNNNNNNNKDQRQQMIQSISALFKWLMPLNLNLSEEEQRVEREIRSAAYEFCGTPEVEAFILEVMIPNAFEGKAIIVIDHVLCSLARVDNKRKLFTSEFAARQLLEMAARAPTQKALEWSFGAMLDITEDADDSVVQNYATEENAKLLLQAFQRVEDGTCLELAAEFLCNVARQSRSSSYISQICTEEFASAVLDKLSITESTVDVTYLSMYIIQAVGFQSNFCSFLCTEDAAKIILRASKIVNDNDSAENFCLAIGCFVFKSAGESLNFATQEFCAAIVRCLDFAETDYCRDNCAMAISKLAFECESACAIFASIPNIAEKLHDAINNTEDLNEATYLFYAIANICVDKECTRPFANLKTLQLLVDSRKKLSDPKTLGAIDRAMSEIVLQFPEFLDFCTAQSDATTDHQQRLLQVTTLEQLATFLKYDSRDFFDARGNQFIQRCSLLIICEKLDQFILSREENHNQKTFRKSLATICRRLCALTFEFWDEILNRRFLDTVVFSLLEHGNGETCVDAADLILWNNHFLSSSMLKVILEKMDRCKKDTCFEKDFNGDSFFTLGIELLRRAVSENSKDLSKTFFVENLNLINRVLKKGRASKDAKLRKEIDETIDEIKKFDPEFKDPCQNLTNRKESGQRRDRDGNPSTME
jgi:hypothetical protein